MLRHVTVQVGFSSRVHRCDLLAVAYVVDLTRKLFSSSMSAWGVSATGHTRLGEILSMRNDLGIDNRDARVRLDVTCGQ